MPFVSPELFAKERLVAIQDYSILSWRAVVNIFSKPRYLADVYTQMDYIGVGSMKVTEQIDAMRALGTDPLRKLVTPRLYATIFMRFFLTIMSDACGIAGGALVSVALLGLNASSYFHNSYRALAYGDIVQGLTKPLFSGFIIATVGCYFGMKTTGGTQGVGRATTQAVVVSSVFIIIVDFLVSRLMIGIFGS